MGFLQAVWNQYTFDFYAGVSAGAIVSSCLAIGKTPDQIWELVQDKKLIKVLFDVSPRNF